jgi:hypothetical protein
MIPLSRMFFDEFEQLFERPFHGLQGGRVAYWSDPGNMYQPPINSRGLPPQPTHASGAPDFVTGVEIGAAQGIILGTPDAAATHTLDAPRFVHSANDILRHGFVVHPQAFCVFNSQLTAFRREFAPCFAQFYKWQQRNTDMFASVIMRRVMRETNHYTFFGPPFAYHNRAPRPLFNDLKAEMYGMEHIDEFTRALEGIENFPEGKLAVQVCYDRWANKGLIGGELWQAMNAWVADCERALG